jgi:hypothetical protein
MIARNLVLAAGLIGLATAAHASQITISRTATGSVTPPLLPGTQSYQNGDFFIQANNLAPWTGDGVDETTTWWFSFSLDQDFNAFRASNRPVVSAVLTLTLTQFYVEGPITDLVRPVLLFPIIEIPHYLGQGETGDISFELLDYYTADQIKSLATDQFGRVQFVYADDAIVSFSSLEISLACTADQNADGQVDFFDYLDFVSAFDAQDPSADMNGDNQVDFFDYLDFAADFAAGC